MTKVALRSYIQEIESLIGHGQIEEAISHCKFILRSYPKCVNAYRMLGKAYLESQRYSEAADILQRILSVFPDDFVSQIGMSIIREDEANLDAAIFHMERAFEIQPSNPAVQEELRRLYGRRDGVEPPRIRLTRGALVRMYARGDLYRQAIAEIRVALAEEPNRIDLEIILAKMYYVSGQKAESTEVCGRLIAKLPYCYEANRILAEILPGTSRSADAQTYQQRLIALDPYTSFISSSAPTVDQVPDISLMIDRLEWSPTNELPAQPEWAKIMGVQLDENQKPLPDWLSEIPAIPASTNPDEIVPVPLPGEENKSDETIPSWMKEAGWGESTGEFKEGPVSFDEEEPVIPSEDLAPADVPEWLRSIAPSDDIVSGQIPTDNQGILDGTKGDTNASIPETPSVTNEENAPDHLSDWISSLNDAPSASQLPTEPSSEKLPEWLSSFEDISSEETKLRVENDAEPKNISEEKPAEIISDQIETDKPMTSPSGNLPDWLKSLEEDLLPDKETISQTEIDLPTDEIAETTDISKETLPTTEIAPSPGIDTESDNQDIDASLAWLEGLAARQGAADETLSSTREERLEPPPDWIQTLSSKTEIEEQEVSQDVVSPPTSTIELPVDEIVEQIEETKEEITLDIPSLPSEPIISSPTAEVPTDIPTDDVDAALAWLESLAAKQGAAEEELTTSPEERQVNRPDWVTEAQEKQDAIDSSVSEPQPPPVTPFAEESPQAEHLPKWLEQFEEPAANTSDNTMNKGDAELTPPAWVMDNQIPDLGKDVEERPVDEQPEPIVVDKSPDKLKPIVEKNKSIRKKKKQELTVEPTETKKTLTPKIHPELDDVIIKAHNALTKGNLGIALDLYHQVIKEDYQLSKVIENLGEALDRYPVDPFIWERLGDAQSRANNLQEALDAYTKAEEFLK